MNREKLEAKVKAVNLANQAANSWKPALVNFFKAYVGKKIFKANGGLMASVADKMPQLADLNGVSFYGNNSQYSLWYVAKSCVSYAQSCIYYEVGMRIGDMENGVLKGVYEFDPAKDAWREDFSADEVIAKMKAVEEAEKALDAAKGNLYPFQMNDSWGY